MSPAVLNLSTGPHIRDRWTTPFIMHVVTLSLLPTAVMGVINHGLDALWVILACVIAAVATELVFDKLCRRPDTWKDGSAVVTGLTLALTLSPYVPVYQAALGAIFAILVVKCCFGGLGKNFLNPALAGRCFLLVSFSNSMTQFAPDGVSGATPVADLLAGETVNVTQMFLGQTGGVIGNCVLTLLIGGLILWSLDIIHGQICFSILGAFTLFLALFGGHGFDPGYLAAHLCGGGVMLGAFFMATDYVTSPVSRLGQTIYGVMIGVLGALFRIYGSSADSFCYSILIGNLFVPLIHRYIIPKPYAFRKKAMALQRGETPKPLLRRIPKPVISLTVIALLAGLALSGVYSLTKDTIDEQKAQAAAAAYREVVPEAESFEAVAAAEEFRGSVYGTEFGRVYLNEAVTGITGDGTVAGYAVSVTSAEGYDGNITLTVGISPEGRINGISFTELTETPGKGMLADEPEFKNQFAGRAAQPLDLLPGGGAAAENEIDGVSGATITSKAIVNAVNAAVDFYLHIGKGDAS